MKRISHLRITEHICAVVPSALRPNCPLGNFRYAQVTSIERCLIDFWESNMNNHEKFQLVGWDDNKTYFYDDKGSEWCVNDEKELFDKLLTICKDYFEEKRRKSFQRENR